jgi:hypothetical protein
MNTFDATKLPIRHAQFGGNRFVDPEIAASSTW